MAVSSLDLSCPMPGDTVGYMFTASGFATFDAPLAADLPITVKLLDAAGGTISTKVCTALTGSTSALFAVLFNVTQDFDDCTLEASIAFGGGAATNTDQVQNIDIDDNNGGFFNIVFPPPPILIP